MKNHTKAKPSVRSSERLNRLKTASQLRRDLIQEGTELSLSAMKVRLGDANLNGRVARKKSLISETNAFVVRFFKERLDNWAVEQSHVVRRKQFYNFSKLW